VPPDRYRDWANALGVPVQSFVKELMRFYDPITFDILFGEDEKGEATSSVERSA
jgi:hypothetical protein